MPFVEKIILFSIILGPSEPTLTINSYLSPLISNLKEIWTGVNTKTTIRCALHCQVLGCLGA